MENPEGVTTDEVKALGPLLARIASNTGQYAGDHQGDAARRVLAFLIERGWTPPGPAT